MNKPRLVLLTLAFVMLGLDALWRTRYLGLIGLLLLIISAITGWGKVPSKKPPVDKNEAESKRHGQ